MPSRLNYLPILRQKRDGGFPYLSKVLPQQPHKFGCVMACVPMDLRKEITDWTLENIPNEYLAEEGRENHPHVTLLFGTLGSGEDITNQLRETLRRFGPFEVILSKLSLFTGGKDGDVLKVDIDGLHIHQLHELLAATISHQDTHPDYLPHLTLAYLDPTLGISEKCTKLNPPFLGKSFRVTEAEFSDANNHKVIIPMVGNQEVGQKGIKSSPEGDGKWITVNGTHIHVDGSGDIDKGPEKLRKKPEPPKVEGNKLKEKYSNITGTPSNLGEVKFRKTTSSMIDPSPGSVYRDIDSVMGKEFNNEKLGEKLASMLGAQGNVKVTLNTGYGSLSIQVEGEGYTMFRTLTRENGELICTNNLITVIDKGKGLGIQLFTNQVKQLSEMGASKIKCQAAGRKGEETVGYKVWPKFGYDGPLSDEHKQALSSQFQSVSTIQELYAIPGGREEWEEKGFDIDLSFDLKPNSKSMEILDEYLEKKKSEGKKSLFYSVKNFKQKQGTEEPDLSPEDEKALEEVWQERTREAGQKGIKAIPATPIPASSTPKSPSTSPHPENEQGYTGEIEDKRGHTICYRDGKRVTCGNNEPESSSEKEVNKEEGESAPGHGEGGEKEPTPENPQDKLPDDPFDKEWDKIVSEHIDEIEKNDVRDHEYSAQEVAREQNWHKQILEYKKNGGKTPPGVVSRFISGLANSAIGTLEYISEILDENGELIAKTPKEIHGELKNKLDEINPGGPANGLLASVIGGLFGQEGVAVTNRLKKDQANESKANKAKDREAEKARKAEEKESKRQEKNKPKEVKKFMDGLGEDEQEALKQEYQEALTNGNHTGSFDDFVANQLKQVDSQIDPAKTPALVQKKIAEDPKYAAEWKDKQRRIAVSKNRGQKKGQRQAKFTPEQKEAEKQKQQEKIAAREPARLARSAAFWRRGIRKGELKLEDAPDEVKEKIGPSLKGKEVKRKLPTPPKVETKSLGNNYSIKKWVTIEHSHVLLDGSGDIVKGPNKLVGEKPNQLPARDKPETPSVLGKDKKKKKPTPEQTKEKVADKLEGNKPQETKQEAKQEEKLPEQKESEGKPISDDELDKMKLKPEDYNKIKDPNLRAEVKTAVDDYAVGATYEMTNGLLRGKIKDKDLGGMAKIVRRDVDRLKTAFDEFGHTLEKPVVVYRGIGKLPANLEVGSEFTDKGFGSTTTDKEFADIFAKQGGEHGKLLLITVPKGEKVLVPIGPKNKKKEVLLNTDTKYQVSKIEGNVVHMEIVPSSEGKDRSTSLKEKYGKKSISPFQK